MHSLILLLIALIAGLALSIHNWLAFTTTLGWMQAAYWWGYYKQVADKKQLITTPGPLETEKL